MAYEDGDYKAALEFYKMAKKMKHPRALNNLGKLFMENLVPEKVKVKGDHFRKAIKYFELAAEFGHVKALFNLGSLKLKKIFKMCFREIQGVCYEKGIGVEQNLEKAYRLFNNNFKYVSKQRFAVCLKIPRGKVIWKGNCSIVLIFCATLWDQIKMRTSWKRQECWMRWSLKIRKRNRLIIIWDIYMNMVRNKI